MLLQRLEEKIKIVGLPRVETRRLRLLEPPERALARMDRLGCFGDSRKTLYSSFGTVGISESSAETEAARINFRMNSGKALELPLVDSFV